MLAFVFFFVFYYSADMWFRVFMVLITTCLFVEGKVGMRVKEKWNLGSQRNVYQKVITIIMYSVII